MSNFKRFRSDHSFEDTENENSVLSVLDLSTGDINLSPPPIFHSPTSSPVNTKDCRVQSESDDEGSTRDASVFRTSSQDFLFTPAKSMNESECGPSGSKMWSGNDSRMHENFNESTALFGDTCYDNSSSESSSGSESAGLDLGDEVESQLSFSEDDVDDNLLQGDDPPVYKGCPIKISESMTAILSYVIRHELDGTQIIDLLKLINLHCIQEQNEMKASLYLFKKYFSCLDCPVIYHYYCSLCFSKLEQKASPCPNANLHPGPIAISIFVELPLIPQLQKLFSNENFCANLNYRQTRKKLNPLNLEDIYDGQLYKELAEQGFLSNEKPYNFSLIFNTDGVPVFKSTNKSLWPLYLNVNELPPHLRFRKENTLIAGLWFGAKPAANLILEPLLPTFQAIRKGFMVVPSTTKKPTVAQGMLLAGTSDLPAKVMITGMASYSGAFGCQICKQKGEGVKIIKGKKKNLKKATENDAEETAVKTSSVWVYKYSRALNLRSHQETIRLGEEAVRALQETGNPHTNISGVKFPSALFKIMYDGIRGFAVDDLHTLYLGVTKTLIKLQFSAPHSSEPFSIRKHLALVDKRIMDVKLPNFIKRDVRKIEDDFAYFKGSELQTWLHYLSIPILDGILPDKYLENHIDLVSSLHILQSASISPEALLNCENTLNNFVKNFEILYGTRYMSMVIHLLRHLVFVVNNLGPMRFTSCFPYESLNGEILKMVHGTRYVETQLASGCFLIKMLPRCLESLNSEHVQDFCSKLLHPSLRLKKLENLACDSFSVGTYSAIPAHNVHVFDALQQVGVSKETSYIESFFRLKKGKLLFVCRSYLRCEKKNSFTCSFMSQANLYFGAIDIFVKVTCDLTSQCYAIIELATVQPYVVISKQVDHIQKFFLTGKYVAVPLEDLKEMLVCVKVDSNFYVCNPL